VIKTERGENSAKLQNGKTTDKEKRGVSRGDKNTVVCGGKEGVTSEKFVFGRRGNETARRGRKTTSQELIVIQFVRRRAKWGAPEKQ